MDTPINNNIIVKTAKKNGTTYGLGKDGKAYKLQGGAYLIKGEYRLASKWLQVHYMSHEKLEALHLLHS